MAHRITPPLRGLLMRAASAGWHRGLTAQFQERPVPEGLGGDVEEILQEHPQAVKACGCFDEVKNLLDRYIGLLAHKRILLGDKTGTLWKRHGVTCTVEMVKTENDLKELLKKMQGRERRVK